MKIFLDSYGCTANQADANILKGVLLKAGHTLADLESSGIVVLNTCAVKLSTENRMFSRIEKYQQQTWKSSQHRSWQKDP